MGLTQGGLIFQESLGSVGSWAPSSGSRQAGREGWSHGPPHSLTPVAGGCRAPLPPAARQPAHVCVLL